MRLNIVTIVLHACAMQTGCHAPTRCPVPVPTLCRAPAATPPTRLHIPSRLVERYLLDNYKPHQLSTYALTLYRHDYDGAAGRKLPVGERDHEMGPMGCCGQALLFPLTCPPHVPCPALPYPARSLCIADRSSLTWSPPPPPSLPAPSRHLGHRGAGAVQQHARLVLLPSQRMHHGV